MRRITGGLSDTGRPALAFGGDYNPEQWPEPVWAQDIALMREAGVNLVSVAIFSWALLEPAEGDYRFGWLDRVLDLLHGAGIRVDLANASASPPPWFSRRYPESLPVTADGVRISYGSRQAFCPSNPDYRRAAGALTEAIAQRYAEHPAVVMWHVHNEYGCHNAHCFCDVSAAAFRDWLRRRYGGLAELNQAWGTAFWSQRYYDWNEILPPRRSGTWVNPTQQLDFWRFSSDELLDCFRAEAAVLRAHSSHPVTTNFMSFFKPLDYFRWAREMDVVSNDHYLIVDDRDPAEELAMAADLVRGLAGGQPWLLMEHSTSAVNWQPRNRAKAPGEMQRNSLQHVARGSDGALFFQWRASAAGAEKFHSALLPHAGRDSLRWREVTELGAVLGRLGELAGSVVEQAEVAIVYDWQSRWAAELDSHPSVDVDPLAATRQLYSALWRSGVRCDFVPPDGSYDGYRVLLVPQLYLLPAEHAAALAAFVEAGGTVLVSYFSGIVDSADHIVPGGYPGALRELLGIRIEEFFPLLAGQSVALSDYGSGVVWSELGRTEGAEQLAGYAGGPVAGSPAVTRNRVGAGQAWYLGTTLADQQLAALLARVLAEAGVRPLLAGLPARVEVVRRRGEDAGYTFVLNHTGEPVPVPLSGTELVTGERVEAGSLVVPAGGVRVVRD
ncbi:beta-galactosidase [Jatrophihabitans sp.]|uniref:beta-galactosidase n=1 Tax=Jatrophihabitans sp. TaxID=1932789 RepID=UPI0038CD87CB